jgi:ribokinase
MSSSGSDPIVCVGAHIQALFMHVERVPREGESVRGWGALMPVDGGKVANAAVAAARLGASVRLITVVGTDARSDWWLAFFQREGVDTAGIIRIEGAMDVGPVLLPPSGIPAIVSVSDLSARLDASAVASRAELIADASVVVCALESPADGVQEAFRIARAKGAVTVLNASPAAPVAPDLAAQTDVLVVNEEEARLLSGARSAEVAAAELLRALDPRAVIVTAGGSGAFVAERGRSMVRVPAPLVEAVDTTGAGDAFVGALATRIREGAVLTEAVPFAVRAASLSCTRPFTMPSFPTRGELERDEMTRGS